MTGFGKVTAELPSKVTVEIKALNSKQLDLSTRIPSIYKEKECKYAVCYSSRLNVEKSNLIYLSNISVKTRPHRSTWLR